jgi:glutaredoxin
MKSIKVYGADWCEDTQRAIAHLERERVPFDYINVDDDPEASEWVKRQNNGKERKPTIEIEGRILSQPTNDEIDAALA